MLWRCVMSIDFYIESISKRSWSFNISKLKFSKLKKNSKRILPVFLILGYRLACKEAVKYIQDHLTYKVSVITQLIPTMKLIRKKITEPIHVFQLSLGSNTS